MKAFVLIISDRDMRPRSDMMTATIFAKRDDAFAAMEKDISSAIESGQTSEDEIKRCPDYTISSDGRFTWKVEERIVCEAVK